MPIQKQLIRPPVLPNFISVLAIATIGLASAASYAGHHEKSTHAKQESGEDRIVELKEMTPSSDYSAPVEERKMPDTKTAESEEKLADEINSTTKKRVEEPQLLNSNR
jgi:hypothetical protein